MSAPRQIRYTTGDAAWAPPWRQPVGDVVIAHVCSRAGHWQGSFMSELGQRWPYAVESFQRWAEEEQFPSLPFALGQYRVTVPPVPGHKVMIVHMVAVDAAADPPLSYGALEQCLEGLAGWCLDTDGRPRARMQMPRIGCGAAGGRWERVAALVQEQLCSKGIEVTVYDKEQQP